MRAGLAYVLGAQSDVEALVDALHQKTVENLLLRQQLAEGVGVLRMLPTQPRVGDTTHSGPPDLL